MQIVSQISIVAFVVTILSSCAPSENNSAEVRPAHSTDAQTPQSISLKIESIAKSAVARGIIEGIQFTLIEGGQPLSTQAFGLADRERNVTMTVHTPINIASISKSLTAWGMMAFLEQYKLSLDGSVRDLLIEDDLYNKLYPGADVTIRMLLSHTSGLSGASVPVTPATEQIPGIDGILLGRSSVPRARLRRAPDGDYLYSGAGYLVLQKIIEDQTGLTFADFMAETVLGPAQMSDSAFALTPQMIRRVSVYYRADGRRREPYHLPGAAGGLYSTASDMANFLSLYLESGSETRARIISDQNFAALMDPIVDAVDRDGSVRKIQYALGHYTYETLEGTGIVFHAGGNPGLRAIYIIAPDHDIGLFAVANNDNGSEVLAEIMRVWGDNYDLTLHEYF